MKKMFLSNDNPANVLNNDTNPLSHSRINKHSHTGGPAGARIPGARAQHCHAGPAAHHGRRPRRRRPARAQPGGVQLGVLKRVWCVVFILTTRFGVELVAKHYVMRPRKRLISSPSNSCSTLHAHLQSLPRDSDRIVPVAPTPLFNATVRGFVFSFSLTSSIELPTRSFVSVDVFHLEQVEVTNNRFAFHFVSF